MFDIAFSELLVIAVVALIVIGPERLPKTARMLGHLFGRLQRYVNEVKSDISREMELDELRKLQQQVHSAARDLESTVTSAVSAVESNVRSVERELNSAIPSDTPSPGAGAAAGSELPYLESSSFGAVPAAESTVAEPPPAAAEPPRQASLPGLERP